ncbi:MAG: hypothetical protein NTV84_03465 [Methanoregula sp.]|nr:hypothetical protein [Methanoregula sp.]
MSYCAATTRYILLAALLLTGIFVFAAGCSSPTPASIGAVIPTPFAVNVSIQPDITRYTLAMSSAPGIGLLPILAGQAPAAGNYFYVWKTDYGQFLDWKAPDFTVKELGSDVRVPGGKVYWTYGSAAAGKERPVVHITLDVVDAVTGATIGHAERIIGWGEEDMAEIR